MAAGEGQRSGEEGARRRLGLERLSPLEIWLVGQFVVDAAAGLREQYQQELRETLLDMPGEDRQTTVEQLAGSEVSDVREMACSVIAHYTERNPDVGYPLWRQLMRDENASVRESAQIALTETLGVLDFDPKEIVRVIDAYYDGLPSGRSVLPPDDLSSDNPAHSSQ